LKELAQQNIPVVEILTTPKKLILIVKETNIDKAFTALRKALS